MFILHTMGNANSLQTGGGTCEEPLRQKISRHQRKKDEKADEKAGTERVCLQQAENATQSMERKRIDIQKRLERASKKGSQPGMSAMEAREREEQAENRRGRTRKRHTIIYQQSTE